MLGRLLSGLGVVVDVGSPTTTRIKRRLGSSHAGRPQDAKRTAMDRSTTEADITPRSAVHRTRRPDGRQPRPGKPRIRRCSRRWIRSVWCTCCRRTPGIPAAPANESRRGPSPPVTGWAATCRNFGQPGMTSAGGRRGAALAGAETWRTRTGLAGQIEWDCADELFRCRTWPATTFRWPVRLSCVGSNPDRPAYVYLIFRAGAAHAPIRRSRSRTE